MFWYLKQMFVGSKRLLLSYQILRLFVLHDHKTIAYFLSLHKSLCGYFTATQTLNNNPPTSSTSSHHHRQQ